MTFAHHRFAGERTLVDAQRGAAQQQSVGGNFLAGFKHHYIAFHEQLTRYFSHFSAANHLHRHLVVNFIEKFEFFVGIQLHQEAHHRGKQHRHKYAYRFEKGLEACAYIYFVNCHAKR